MEHIAIDLAAKQSQICVRRADGTIIEERRHDTGQLQGYLAKRPKSRVVVETSAEAFAVADGALQVGHEVRVVRSALAPMLGVGEHGVKNDQRDARALSKASCAIDLKSVHIPSLQSRERKTMCGMRDSLVQARTQMINCVRGYLRSQLIRLAKGSSKTFPSRVREKLLKRSEGLPACVEWLLASIDELSKQIAAADNALGKIAKDDATCRRLMTVPGVGALTAIRFSSALDQIERFSGAHRVESYLGLTPKENSSGERERRGAITKAGPSAVRWTLVQACWSAMRTRPQDPMVVWAKQVALRRGKRVAVIALARKMAGILFALWRDQTNYDPAYGLKTEGIEEALSL
jgi:transposase